MCKESKGNSRFFYREDMFTLMLKLVLVNPHGVVLTWIKFFWILNDEENERVGGALKWTENTQQVQAWFRLVSVNMSFKGGGDIFVNNLQTGCGKQFANKAEQKVY